MGAVGRLVELGLRTYAFVDRQRESAENTTEPTKTQATQHPKMIRFRALPCWLLLGCFLLGTDFGR